MKKKKSPIFLYILLILLCFCAFAAFFSGTLNGAGSFFEPSRIWEKLLWPMVRLVAFISIGLFVGQIIEGMGWTNRLAVIARPLMRWGHLSDQMGAAFSTAFVSGTASLSMLMSFQKDGSLSQKELTLSVLLNTFPIFFLHLPTTFFIILPLVGKAGVIYVAITFGAALLRLGAVLICTHFMLPEVRMQNHSHVSEKKEWQVFLREIKNKFKKRLIRILKIVLPVYLIIALISHMGFFLWLRESLAHAVDVTFIPVEAMSIVVFSLVAEFTSGYAAAGAMLEAGTLDLFQTVIALIIGSIIASPVRAIRHQMPYYMGIFTPATGVRLMIFSQAVRVSSMIMVGLFFVLWMKMFV